MRSILNYLVNTRTIKNKREQTRTNVNKREQTRTFENNREQSWTNKNKLEQTRTIENKRCLINNGQKKEHCKPDVAADWITSRKDGALYWGEIMGPAACRPQKSVFPGFEKIEYRNICRTFQNNQKDIDRQVLNITNRPWCFHTQSVFPKMKNSTW